MGTSDIDIEQTDRDNNAAAAEIIYDRAPGVDISST